MVFPVGNPTVRRDLVSRTATDTDGAPDGFQQLGAMLAGERRAPMGDRLGFNLVELERGRAVFAATPDRSVYNPLGAVHGGYAATLLDSACGIAVHSQLARQPRAHHVGAQGVVSAPALSDRSGTVRATGRVLSLGRRVAFAEATLHDGEHVCAPRRRRRSCCSTSNPVGPDLTAGRGSMATTMQSEWDVGPSYSERLTAGRLVLLASLAALGSLATNIMLPAFPAMARELGVAPRELAWTLSSFFVVFAVGQLFVGPLTDAVGRTPLVVAGLAIFLTGSLVCTLAPSLPVLIAGRAIQALGACAASVLARAIARDLYHGPELTRALALVMIATAAAPGFSPALGTGMTLVFGWRSAFVLVAVAAAVVAFHYRLSLKETLPPRRRRPARLRAIARTYVELTIDSRFIFPALTVSLVIGCLYSFFGAAPTILMNNMGLTATSLSIFFAATVFVVFGSGLITSRLSRRWGAPRVGMAGVVIALTGGLWLLVQAGAPTLVPFMAAVTMFLGGMGLINPIGTAITLEPFGDRAGIASALLGFLQMTCAAIGTAIIGALPVGTGAALAWVVFGGTVLAAAAFLPVLLTDAAGSARSALDRRSRQPDLAPTSYRGPE